MPLAKKMLDLELECLKTFFQTPNPIVVLLLNYNRVVTINNYHMNSLLASLKHSPFQIGLIFTLILNLYQSSRVSI